MGRLLDCVEEVAKKKAASMAIVAMVRCLEKGANPIIGLSSNERVDEAVDVVTMAKEGLSHEGRH